MNISQFIDKINEERNSIIKLINDLGKTTNFSILKLFCPLINFYVSVDNSILCKLDCIKFKEIFFYNYLKALYISSMVNYLDANSNEFF